MTEKERCPYTPRVYLECQTKVLFVKFYNFFTKILHIDNINKIYYRQRNISEKANPERLGGAKLRDQSVEEGICNLLKVMVSVESAGLPITQVM